MKQLPRTAELDQKLRASYGPDAEIANLAVWEVVLANQSALRKSGGIFQGARLEPSLISEIVAAVNAESVPLQLSHDTQPMPVGRVFAAMDRNGEARGLIAVDKVVHADLAAKLDSGTIDQVSIGVVPNHIRCSACGFDFAAPGKLLNLMTLTCENDHVVGQGGVFTRLSSLKSLFETSLVGQGAVKGARVVGPSDSAFQNNQRLAASAGDAAFALYLTATPQEETMELKDVLAQLSSVTTEKALVDAQVLSLTSQLEAATAQATELQTQLQAASTATTELATTKTALTAATEDRDAALAALRTEATKILTACGKADQVDALAAKSVAEVIAVIDEHRAQFAAMIPAGGAANAADASTQAAVRASTSAFRTPRR